jgi:hypothetical protein
MEKYTVQTIKLPSGKTFSTYSFRFTEEERNDLKKALVKFPKERIELFINGLENFCRWGRNFVTQRNITFERAEKKRMLRHFEKTSEELFAFIDQGLTAEEKKSIFDIGVACDVEVCERERLRWLMLSAGTQLKEICKIIKEDHSQPGRPSADAATGELVKVIAHGFQNHFQKPTGYRPSKNPESGPFFAVVQIALKACELPFEYPERHIRAALKSL